MSESDNPQTPPSSNQENTQPPPPPPIAPVPQEPQTTGLAPNVAAGLAALFPLIGGIVFYVLEKKDAFVRFHAMQSIYFGGTILVVNIAVMILSAILAAIPIIGWIIGILLGILSFVLMIVFLVFGIINVVKAFQGVRYEIPYIGKMAKAQLEKSNSSLSV